MDHYVPLSEGAMGSCTSTPEGIKIEWHEHAMRPGRSDQDFAIKGSLAAADGGSLPYIAVVDGHGSDKVIDALRDQVNWSIALEHQAPTEYISERIAALGDTFKSGACLALARTRLIDGMLYLDCEWLGDCHIVVFKDDTCIWESTPHSSTSDEGRSEASQRGFGYSEGYGLQLLDGQNEITLERCGYTVWSTRGEMKDMTAPSRCLGHNALPRQSASTRRIRLHAGHRWRVVCMTDGVTDMTRPGEVPIVASSITGRSADIVKLAHQRWHDRYKYVHPIDCPCPLCNPTDGPRRRTVDPKPAPIDGGADDITCSVLQFTIA